MMLSTLPPEHLAALAGALGFRSYNPHLIFWPDTTWTPPEEVDPTNLAEVLESYVLDHTIVRYETPSGSTRARYGVYLPQQAPLLTKVLDADLQRAIAKAVLGTFIDATYDPLREE